MAVVGQYLSSLLRRLINAVIAADAGERETKRCNYWRWVVGCFGRHDDPLSEGAGSTCPRSAPVPGAATVRCKRTPGTAEPRPPALLCPGTDTLQKSTLGGEGGWIKIRTTDRGVETTANGCLLVQSSNLLRWDIRDPSSPTPNGLSLVEATAPSYWEVFEALTKSLSNRWCDRESHVRLTEG